MVFLNLPFLQSYVEVFQEWIESFFSLVVFQVWSLFSLQEEEEEYLELTSDDLA